MMSQLPLLIYLHFSKTLKRILSSANAIASARKFLSPTYLNEPHIAIRSALGI